MYDPQRAEEAAFTPESPDQIAYTESRRAPADDDRSAAEALRRAGRWVVVNLYSRYCRATDAILPGQGVALIAVAATEAEAKAAAAEAATPHPELPGDVADWLDDQDIRVFGPRSGDQVAEEMIEERRIRTFDGENNSTTVTTNPRWAGLRVGSEVKHVVAAPGIGHRLYIVTRIDSECAYGACFEDTVRELTIADVI